MCLIDRWLGAVVLFVSLCSIDFVGAEHNPIEPGNKDETAVVVKDTEGLEIHGGELVDAGKLKFVVGIRVIYSPLPEEEYDFPEVVTSICTGALVGYHFILTAAHCIPRVAVYHKIMGAAASKEYSFSSLAFEFYAGTNTMNSEQVDKKHAQIVKVEYPKEVALHVHPDAYKFRLPVTKYLLGQRLTDVLLFQLLKTRFTITEFVDALPVVKLPIPAMVKDKCQSVGFGNQNDEAHDDEESKLYSIEVTAGGEAYCDVLRQKNFSRTFHLCVHAGDMQDSCTGDSGGPLVCGKNGKYYTAGVLSVGADAVDAPKKFIGCGGTNTSFGIYIYPGLFEDWMQNVTNEIMFVTWGEAKSSKMWPDRKRYNDNWVEYDDGYHDQHRSKASNLHSFQTWWKITEVIFIRVFLWHFSNY